LGLSKICIISYLSVSLSSSTQPAARGYNPVDEERRGGITLPAATDRDYELRSRGPATRDFGVLDTCLKMYKGKIVHSEQSHGAKKNYENLKLPQ
jgi:hypothetical protein